MVNKLIHNAIDINECSSNTDQCSNTCINTIGSYVCDCNVGYVLDDNGVNCIGKLVRFVNLMFLI